MQDSSQQSASARLESIDCLRGIAALGVVWVHAMTYGTPPQDVRWLQRLSDVSRYGGLGVTLFFIISGFCIHLRWAQQQAVSGRAQLNWLAFWKRRIYRLYPPYFVVLCLSMGMVVMSYFLGKQTVTTAAYPEPKSRWMILDFVSHVLMLHGFHPVLDRGAGNPPFWTLAREEQFYLLYLPLLALRQRVGLALSFVGVVLLGHYFPFLMAFVLPANSIYWSVVDSSSLVLWFQWCLGMVAVESYYGLGKLPAAWWFAGFPVVVALMMGNGRFYNIGWAGEFLLPVGIFLMLGCCVMLERAGRWPQQYMLRWLARVGTFSYSLYLVHMLVLSIVQKFLPTKLTQNPWLYLLNACIISITCYYAGLIFFLVVERRFLHARPVYAPQTIWGA